MSIRNSIREHRNVIAVTVPIVIILVPILYSIVVGVGTGDSDAATPFLSKPDPKYENCVKETAYMRFHHWELLRQVREEYVRHGIRGEISLSGCRECHPNRDQFCNQCHRAVNLNPDCFGCHYYPESPAADAEDPHAGVTSHAADRTVAIVGNAAGG